MQELVKKTLHSKGVTIIKEGELTAEQISTGKLIDKHYYAISKPATLVQPKELPVPVAKFQEAFGLSWEKALQDGVVYNALDACTYLNLDAAGLDKAWAKAKKVKFGGKWEHLVIILDEEEDMDDEV